MCERMYDADADGRTCREADEMRWQGGKESAPDAEGKKAGNQQMVGRHGGALGGWAVMTAQGDT